eukprot:TRINITY_DN815_c0_g2_i1.p1 TRINITY_DN815_c0_g2~~TRINITY_DN815_c0_g2_i1.p1  ORF type:complete len:558 (+),score=47.03 TRINITY_DN815_c0_g2_i1:36-1709(+)
MNANALKLESHWRILDEVSKRFKKRLPAGYWSNLTNQKQALGVLARQLRIQSWDAWYKVTVDDFHRHGLGSLLQMHKGSPSKVILAAFSEHPWDASRFATHAPQGYWHDLRNQRTFMEQLGKALSISSQDDWYSVAAEDFSAHGGKSVLLLYGGSPSKAVTSIFHEFEWDLNKFRTTLGFWNNFANHRRFLDKLAQKLNINHWEDWYSIQQHHFFENGGTTLLKKYGGSPFSLVSSVYPDFPWKRFRFGRVRGSYWTSELNVREFFDYVAAAQHICAPSEWKKIAAQLIKKLGGSGLFKHYGKLHNALRVAYPFAKSSAYQTKISRPQQQLLSILQTSFGGPFQVNYKHPELVHKQGNTKMEFDIWIEEFKMGIEYQGEHHYYQLWERCQDSSIRMFRDEEKIQACSEMGITLVQIPFWWDGSQKQLLSTIGAACPLFLEKYGQRDQLDLAAVLSPDLPHTERIYMSVALSQEWNGGIATNWFASEKCDGIRAIWDGTNLVTRQGQVLTAPEWFKRNLPSNSSLDGELWVSRNAFYRCLESTREYDWDGVTYEVFDS